MNEQDIKLYAALVKAQSEVEAATKDKQGQIGTQKYKYADLSQVDEVIKGPLTDNGLAIVQFPGKFENGCVSLTSMVIHQDGGSITEEMTMPVAMTSPRDGVPFYSAQSVGSALTYARRYALCAIMRIVTEDDDGKRASNPVHERGGKEEPYYEETLREAGAARTKPDPMPWDDEPSAPSQRATATPIDTFVPFNIGLVNNMCDDMKFPSRGILGWYFTGSMKAVTDKMLHEHHQANPEQTVEEFLIEAANQYVNKAPDGPMKERVIEWLGNR